MDVQRYPVREGREHRVRCALNFDPSEAAQPPNQRETFWIIIDRSRYFSRVSCK